MQETPRKAIHGSRSGTSGNNQQKIKTGDIVLIHDDKPCIDWRLAVIEDLIPSGDGLICAANIRTSTGKTNRPITKLYPLEINANLETSITTDSTDDPTDKSDGSEISSPLDRCPQRDAARRGKLRISEWSKMPPWRMSR